MPSILLSEQKFGLALITNSFACASKQIVTRITITNKNIPHTASYKSSLEEQALKNSNQNGATSSKTKKARGKKKWLGLVEYRNE